MTGAFDAIDFRGTNHTSLRDEWAAGPRTYLGLTVQHFPNMFMSMGPHSVYGNIPRSIEYAVGWIAECIAYCEEHSISYFEASEEGVSTSPRTPPPLFSRGSSCLLSSRIVRKADMW